MKLYYSRGACSLVCRIIINELGLHSEYQSVDLAKKLTQDGEDYYTINPKGSVPALLTEDNKVLTENAVILQYLADTNDANTLLPSIGNFNRYRVLEWINYIATELHKGFGPLFNSSVPQNVKDEVFMPLLKRKFAYVNKQLEKHTFLSGDQFTLPDAYLFVMLLWAQKFKVDFQEWPHLDRFFSDMLTRKSVQQSLNEEEIKR